MSALVALAAVVGVLVAWWAVTPSYIGMSRRSHTERMTFIVWTAAGASVIGAAILGLVEATA